MNENAITPIIPVSGRKLKNRVSIGTAISNTLVFAKRTLIKNLRNPETLMDVTVMPVLFTLMFTFMFGGAISGSIADYLPIIIPGILIQTYVTSCSVTGVQIREDMDKSITNRFKSMPVARIAPLAGALVADLARFAIAGITVFATGAVIGYRPALPAVAACVLFMMFIAWCLSWMFAYVAMHARSAAAATTVGMMIMFPLSFLSNAFVPTETMPLPLHFFAENINPLSKAITAVRQILNAGTVGADFWLALVGAGVILAVFVPLTLSLYKRKE